MLHCTNRIPSPTLSCFDLVSLGWSPGFSFLFVCFNHLLASRAIYRISQIWETHLQGNVVTMKFSWSGMTYCDQRSLFPVPYAPSPVCPLRPGLPCLCWDPGPWTFSWWVRFQSQRALPQWPLSGRKMRIEHNFCKTADRLICCSGNKSWMEKTNEQHVSAFQISFLEMNESFCFPRSISFLMNSPEHFSLQPII